MEVLPDAVPYLEAFLALETNWRVDAFSGQLLGLDYPALAVVIDLLGLERRKSFQLLRAMERAVLDECRRNTRHS